MKKYLFLLVVVALTALLPISVSAQEGCLLDEEPRIAVISAFEPELTLLLSETEIEEIYYVNGTEFTTGVLKGNDVVLFRLDISMVNAAMKTQLMLDKFNITNIIVSGIAGGVNPDLNIGDVTVPAQWGQYQEALYARKTKEGGYQAPSWWGDLPFPNFGMSFPQLVEVRGEERFWFEVDPQMLAVASELSDVDLTQCTKMEGICLEHDPKVAIGGNGVSGQTFVDNAQYRSYVWDTFQADALDMETAAVAHVAYVNNVPYIAFRSLSDLAGGGPGENQIPIFFQLAADNSALLLLSYLQEWAELKVAFIYVGPVGDMGWSYAHDQGRLYLEQELDYVETTYSEMVPEGADAERVIRDYAEKGYDIIFATSFGYMDSVIEVAKDYPDTIFEHCTGYKIADNVGIYDGRGYQGWYLAGMVAGKMTEKNVLGYVAPYPIPEVIRNMNAFTLGARSVNPEVQTHIVWINTWFDPVKEREAAQALIAEGADVILRESDSPEPDKLAETEGVYAIGYNTDSGPLAPKAVLTCPVWNWGIFYKDTVERVKDGTWDNTPYWGTMADGIMDLSPFGTMVPKSVVKLVEDKKKDILTGKFDVFEGPIKDQKGQVRVKQGETMPDEQKLAFDWLVEGVVGSIPK